MTCGMQAKFDGILKHVQSFGSECNYNLAGAAWLGTYASLIHLSSLAVAEATKPSAH